MAIYHLSVKAISRSTGRSVVAAAAYRSGVALTDERQGIDHDYTRKQGVAAAFIVAPDGADWAQDRDRLWNAAEAAEKRKDAKTGREYELALPAELDATAREELSRSFAVEVVRRYGVAADVAIHEPGREGDNRNHHAHILTTTRMVGADGMGVKTRSLDVSSTASVEIEQLREVWAGQVNAALERHQIRQRVDNRSFARQGIAQEPTIHLGVAASGMERKAARDEPEREPVTERGQQNASVRERNRVLEAAQELVLRLEKQMRELRARLAVGLARKLGQRMEQEREAERQRQELVRQAEIRLAARRQAEQRAAEEARKVAELERQKQRQQEIEQARSRGPSRGRSRGRNYDSGPGMGF